MNWVPQDVVTETDGGFGRTVRHSWRALGREWARAVIGPVGGAMTEGFAGRFEGWFGGAGPSPKGADLRE